MHDYNCGWWLDAGGSGISFICFWTHFGTFELIWGVVWKALGRFGEPLCSHWMPLGDFRELIGHLWCSQAPFWEVLGAPWVHSGSILGSLGLILGASGIKNADVEGSC